MRLIFITITSLALLISCIARDKNRKEAFQWLAFESIPTNAEGKVTGTPSWKSPSRINLHTSDTFVVYGENRDSILIKWKPNPDYGHKFFFIGTYDAKDLPGLYFSFYSTKDWSSLLQICYTNPGNMNMAMLFAKDSANILKQDGIILDPRDEASEPEKGEILIR
jgi:hypothetical protein